MGNPEFLLVDTDALIQVFIAKLRAAFTVCSQRFGVQPAVVPEVEREIRYHAKFGTTFEDRFLKMRSSGHLTTLETSDLRRLLVSRGADETQATQKLGLYANRAQSYSRHVDEGEAHTHAAAVEFGLPMMSHDWRAIKGLGRLGHPTGAPVLRLFDCVVLAEQQGIIQPRRCEQARDRLRQDKEWVPREFDSHQAYADCAASFRCRLGVRPKGSPPSTPRRFDDVLLLEPV